MKYRYERISEKTGRVVDRITVDSAKELIKCIENFEKFLKMNYKQKESNKPEVFIERAALCSVEGIKAICGTDEEYSDYVKKLREDKTED